MPPRPGGHNKRQALALDHAMQTEGATALLWQCAKCHFESPTQRNIHRFNRDPLIANKLLEKIRGKALGQTETYRRYQQIRTQLGIPPEFDHITPGAKVKMLANAKGGIDQVTQFLALGAGINLLRTVKRASPQVRSGINR